MIEGVSKQVGTMRSPSKTLTSRQRRTFLTCLLGLVLIRTGKCLRVLTMPPIGQLAYRLGANHHGIQMFGHAVGFGIQRIAWVAQQVQDSRVSSADLLLLQVLFFVGEEGINFDGWRWHCRGIPFLLHSLALCHS